MAESGPGAVELPDVAAFLLAHLQGDEKTCRELLGMTDGVRLLGYAIEAALQIACTALPGGKGELENMITGWQARRNAAL